MSDEQDPISGSLKAAGVAVGVTTLVGVVISMFGNKEQKQQKLQRDLDSRVADLERKASDTLTQLQDVVADLTTLTAKDGGSAKAAAQRLSRSASRNADRAVAAVLTRAQELEQEARKIDLVEKANALGSEASSQANAALTDFKERSVDLLAEGKRLAPDWKNAAASAAADARARGDNLVERVPEAREQVGKVAHDLAERAREHAPELQEKGQHLFEKAKDIASDLATQAREKAPEVQARAEELIASAGTEAEKLVSTSKDKGAFDGLGQQIANLIAEAQKGAAPIARDAAATASHAVDEAKKAGEHLLPEAKERVAHVGDALPGGSDVTSQLHTLGSTATRKLSDTTEVVQVKSTQAAAAAGRGTKEFTALVGWGAALGGVVYVAFLNESQRKRAKESAKRIGAEAMQVFQEIRGQNGQF